MTIESILGLTAAMLILAASPGPGVFASVSQALSSGFRSSLDVISGIVLGDILFLMFAILGLSTIARVMGDFFFIVKIVGGAYLIWLGVKMWLAPASSAGLNRRVGKGGGWQRFFGGLFITLGNPKVILFYIGFLPTFVDLSSLTLSDVAIVVALITCVLSIVLGTYAYCAARARRLFTSRRAVSNLNRGAGTIMIGAGLTIATR
ncbi:MAG: LysE family translocator [Desulfobacterales bacterium]|nr:LysE family translocator [Desulfobacterales bacterium]